MKIETKFSVGGRVCLLDIAKEGRVLAQEIIAVSYSSKNGTRYHVPGGACRDEPSVVPAPKFKVGDWVDGVYGFQSIKQIIAMKWVDACGGRWAYTLVASSPDNWTEAEIVAADPPKPEPAPAVEFKFEVGQDVITAGGNTEGTVVSQFLRHGIPAYLIANGIDIVRWLYEENLKPA